jgi:hypothetical protein
MTSNFWECERCNEYFPLAWDAQSGTTRDETLKMRTFDEEPKDLSTCVE